MHLNMKECDGIICIRVVSMEIHLDHIFHHTYRSTGPIYEVF